jgi:tetratricopeptide (TPR) repeat protein
MYDPKKFVDVANAIIRGYNRNADRFLDERAAEWARKVENRSRRESVGFKRDDPAAQNSQERLRLINRIISENEKYCRRDIEIPALEFKKQMDRIEELVERRAQAGMTEPHATILSEKANLLMLKGDYKSAQNELDLAISVNEKQEELIEKRDNVRFLGDYVRCLYLQKEFDAAVEKADQARRLASQIPLDKEEAEWMEYAAAPGLEFIPVAVHAYFAACDARVNHERWHPDEQIHREFKGLWSDAFTRYNAPHVWRTPMKIAVVSDRTWVSRIEPYIQDIAEKLYVELAGSTGGRMVRLARTKWGGFNIDYPRTAATAAVLIFFLAVPGVKSSTNPTILTREKIETILSLREVEDSLREMEIIVDPEELKASVDAYIPTVEEAEEFEITPSRTPIFNIASSGSESSVRRI